MQAYKIKEDSMSNHKPLNLESGMALSTLQLERHQERLLSMPAFQPLSPSQRRRLRRQKRVAPVAATSTSNQALLGVS